MNSPSVEASGRWAPRLELRRDSGEGIRWERAGTHWIEAFVVKNGGCVARSGRKFVRIGR